MKTGKTPYIADIADIESLIKKIDGCANNLENSSTTEVAYFCYIPIAIQYILYNIVYSYSILLADIQCQQFRRLITQKTNMLYIT